MKWKKMSRSFRWSVVFIAALTFASLTAEFWSNHVPIVIFYKGQMYFPSLHEYHPRVFGIHDRMNVEYLDLKLERDDWALWPAIRWGAYVSDKSVERFPSPPSLTHPFGTDDRGRDVFSRLLYGFRLSLAYAILVWILSSLCALLAGAAMGYIGSWFDLISQRVVEVLSTVPQLFLLIYLVSIFEPSLTMLSLVGAAFGWIGLSYFVRAEALRTKNEEFVVASIAAGASRNWIIVRHILPNALTPVLTFAPFMIVTNITGLTVLDFMGFGLPPPAPSWGELLSQAQRYFSIAWWLALYPSLMLFLVLFSFSLIGDGVRQWADPRQLNSSLSEEAA